MENNQVKKRKPATKKKVYIGCFSNVLVLFYLLNDLKFSTLLLLVLLQVCFLTYLSTLNICYYK